MDAQLWMLKGFLFSVFTSSPDSKNFKAALINIFKLTKDEMTMCNIEVIRSDKATENYLSRLQLSST